MKKSMIAALMTIAVAAPTLVPSAAFAQHQNDDGRGNDDNHGGQGGGGQDGRGGNGGGGDHGGGGRGGQDGRWQGDRNGGNWEPSQHYDGRNHGERALGRNDRIYRGQDGRAYCRRSDGTTGLVIGAIGGGVLGNLVGGNTLGTLLGAGGGALLGRSVDRGNVRCR